MQFHLYLVQQEMSAFWSLSYATRTCELFPICTSSDIIYLTVLSLAGTFPISLITNYTKNAVLYIFLYISFVKLVCNSQDGSVGLQNITIANWQYILRRAGSIMYLKQEEILSFYCNHSRRCDTISCAANNTVTVCCDCRGTELRQQNCRSRSWPSYLPTVWGKIIIKYVNIIYSTTAVQNSYCYCMNVADGDLLNGTALLMCFCDTK